MSFSLAEHDRTGLVRFIICQKELERKKFDMNTNKMISSHPMNRDDIVRIAVCFPKSTTKFTIYSKIPRLDPKRYLSPVQVGSLEEVDQDKTMTAWYWNQTTGLAVIA